MKYEPHAYQEYATQRIIDNPACALFIACGLGKTVITLTAIRRLKYERWEARKVLIIAPKTVAEDTWQAEARKWDHLTGLRYTGGLTDSRELNETKLEYCALRAAIKEGKQG